MNNRDAHRIVQGISCCLQVDQCRLTFCLSHACRDVLDSCSLKGVTECNHLVLKEDGENKSECSINKESHVHRTLPYMEFVLMSPITSI